MRSEVALTPALALLVVCGALAVHEARRRARPLAAMLALVAVCLGLLAGLNKLLGGAGAPG